MKKQLQQGFTLIELMIVVAIIGILAAVGLPAYQDYTIRAQVSEGPVLAGGLKTGISEYYSDRGVWPATNSALGIGAISGSYVVSVTSVENLITIQYGNRAHANLLNKQLGVSAVDATGSIKWTCSTADVLGTKVDGKYLPTSCK